MPNLAIISAAHIHTKGFLENIAKATDGRNAYAIWDDVPDRGQRYAHKFHTQFVADLEALLGDRSVDGFIICAENTRHLSLLKRLIPVGKPVFCEKPILTTVGELQELKSLLRKHPATRLHSGYFQPFSGTMQAAAALVKSGGLGQVTRIRYRNAHQAAYGRWFDNPDLAWFTNPKLAGGGAFMDMGTHAVHLVRTLFGPVRAVSAIIGNHAGVYPQVDDFGIAQLKFASGVLGTVEAAWTQTAGIGGLEIVGSERTLWNNGNEYLVGGPKIPPQPLSPAAECPTRVDRLVATIRGEISETDLQEDLAASLDAVAIVAAAYEASRTGGWVQLPTA